MLTFKLTPPSSLLKLFTLSLLMCSCGQNPERFDCGTDKSLTVDESLNECEQIGFLSNDLDLHLVARKFITATNSFSFDSSIEDDQQFGEVQEFYKDPSTGLIWQISLNNLAFSQEEAKEICEKKKALKLVWRLPTQDEFLSLANPTNRRLTEHPDKNFLIKEIFSVTLNQSPKKNLNFWTSSVKQVVGNYKKLSKENKSLIFKESIAEASTSKDDFLVQCVSDGTLAHKETDKNKKKN
jgi:hypothetical protein